MTSEGLADLEADYRKVVSLICGVPTSPRVCFGKGGVAPEWFSCWVCRMVFILWMQRLKKFANFARRYNELNEVYITTVIKTLTLASRAHPQTSGEIVPGWNGS